MIYEQALLKALETSKGKAIQRSATKKRKYWRKLIEIELKRIRAGHMTDPWINAAMRYWMNVDKWRRISTIGHEGRSILLIGGTMAQFEYAGYNLKDPKYHHSSRSLIGCAFDDLIDLGRREITLEEREAIRTRFKGKKLKELRRIYG